MFIEYLIALLVLCVLLMLNITYYFCLKFIYYLNSTHHHHHSYSIAPYAFTTIIPNLGVCEVNGGPARGGNAIVIADIPGLVEGASQGVGLGRGFLRHIEVGSR